MHAVLGLLLPLAYEYDPGLVLLARSPGCGVGEAAWAQLTSLLQGLAQGHTLVLLQVRVTTQSHRTSLGVHPKRFKHYNLCNYSTYVF